MSTKDAVLSFLERSRGKDVSGEELAASLSVSRTAVWKAVRSLREEGYPILAEKKRGYRLEEDCDILSPQSIRPFVRGTLFSDIRVYEEVESTNKTAKELAAAGAPGGIALIAERQSAGRGRLGRSFFSPAGAGIYMSVLLRPQKSAADATLITTAAAVAVCRAIKRVCGLETQIKWVNDVYLDGRKLCGILTEAGMNFETGTLDYLVVGIGINVRHSAFPPELRETAISLAERLGSQRIQRSRLIGEILNELTAATEDLEKKTFLTEYRARSFILGKEIYVLSPTSTERAEALDIDSEGRLLVRGEDGQIRALYSGEVSIRPAAGNTAPPVWPSGKEEA